MNRPRLSPQRSVDRQGMLATQTYFESRHHVFQEVAQQNDFGKDAYVDLSQKGEITPLCIALQVKSGLTYRNADGTYAIPVGNHGAMWRESTIPTFGIVFDPTLKSLFWTDLTRTLTLQRELGRVIVPPSQRLGTPEGDRAFHQAVRLHALQPGRDLAARLLSTDPHIQFDAVGDAWALGRLSAHALIALRRLVSHLDVEPTRYAIWRLSHAAHHPDILWHGENWLNEETQRTLRLSYQFSPQEAACLMSSVHAEEWQRGGLGQALYHVLACDPYLVQTAAATLGVLLADDNVPAAAHLLGTAATVSADPRAFVEEMQHLYPQMSEEALVQMWLHDLDQGYGIAPY